MNISKLLKSLLFGLNFNSYIVEEGAGGTPPADDATAATAAAAAAEAAATAAAAAEAKSGVKPTDAEAKLLKEVMQKKEALALRDADLASAQAKLKEFEGIDPTAVRKLLADQKAAETLQLEAKGEYQRVKDQMVAEHQAALAAVNAGTADLTAKLAAAQAQINELTIGTSFAQSKFIADDMTMTPAKARIVYAGHFDLVDGKIVGYDKPRGEANRTPIVDATGNSAGFDAVMAKLVDADPDKNHLLKSKMKSGAGSDTKTNGKPTPTTAPTTSLSKIGSGLASLKIHG